jgi:membrane protein implicated in regulation of membrane protease activity
MPPWSLILIGFLLSILGFLLPLLMLIHVIASTLFLNFFSFSASFIGLALGISGGAMYVRRRRK